MIQVAAEILREYKWKVLCFSASCKVVNFFDVSQVIVQNCFVVIWNLEITVWYCFSYFSDMHGTERVFKKVVYTGQNALRLVDKDGIPMRMPNTATLSRLRSSYVLSPRGVPTRKSNHSYSGQLAQAKMQNLVDIFFCW